MNISFNHIYTSKLNPLKYFPKVDKAYAQLILRNSGLGVLSIAFRYVHSPLSYSFAIGAATQILTIGVITTIEKKFDRNIIIQWKLRVLTFDQNHARFRLVLLIMILATRFIFLYSSIIIASVLGIYSGLMSSIDYYKLQQSNSQTKHSKLEMHKL